jgi:hypothetical protein
MSVKKQIYFGPYLEYVPKQIETTEIKIRCPKCKKKRTVEICPTCKTPTIKTEHPINEDAFTYIEGYNHMMQPHCGGEPMDENLLLPASTEKRPKKFNLDSDNFCGSIPLPNEVEIAADIHWFRLEVMPVLEKFEQYEVQYELKYGFVIHWS